jgi:EmrB/QacA subfamily drug resistance transporter
MTSTRTDAAAADCESPSALISPQRRNIIFVAVLLGMLMAALDQTIVATALPTVVADLGGAGHQSWVVTSYLLASTIATAIVGKLGDLFGRKAVFQVAVLFFLAGSVLCGLAGSMTMLVASRTLQGIGGGAMMVTAMAVIGEVIPLRERGRYQGALGAVFGVTTVIGPLLGGFFTDHLTWRWAFWINVPIAVLVIVVGTLAIPSLAKVGRAVIDYAGILFIGVAASGLTLATSWGGSTYAWSSPMIISLFVGSALALAIFVWVESHVAEPILPIRLFASPVFTVCCILGFIVGFAMLGALTFLPTFMQFVNGVSATESGMRTLPMVAGMLIMSIGSGQIIGRTGRYKVFPVVGTATMAVGFALLSQMGAATPLWQQSVSLFILGAGIGLCMQVLILVVQNTSSFADLGVATSGVTFFRTIGSSFGAAIFGSLFANFLAGQIPAALVASGAPARAADSPQALHALSPEMAAPIVDAYADSLGTVFLCGVPVAVVGFVVSLFLKEVRLREIETVSASDLGEGFGMPSTESPEKILEVAIGRIFRDSPEIRLRSLAQLPGCNLDVTQMWALLQIYRQNQVFGTATLTDIAERLRVPHEVIEPTFDGLIRDGLVLGGGGRLWLTQAGMKQVDAISGLIVGRIVDKLATSSSFEGRPDGDQVEAALERIAHRMLVQRNWTEDRGELDAARSRAS